MDVLRFPPETSLKTCVGLKTDSMVQHHFETPPFGCLYFVREPVLLVFSFC